MKPEDSHSEIGDLLRRHKPEIPVPYGLETRIRRSLDQRVARPRATRRLWPWLVLPTALASLVLIAHNRRPVSNKPLVRQPVVEIPSQTAPAVNVIDSVNPLKSETAALTRDAKRVESFLINCLPSISQRDE